MKKSTKQTLIAILFAISAFTSNAATGDDPRVLLKLAGKEANLPVLQLDIANRAKDLYFITITDQNDVLLHEETAKGENISRRFILNTDDLNGAVLKVTITTRRHTKPAVFEVKMNTTMVQETQVSSISN